VLSEPVTVRMILLLLWVITVERTGQYVASSFPLLY
jgi:hypothetical protein